ncbi:Protein outspread [Trachymyrmex cornetzi]|uniref:Protein outspread n=1 Tax=Trachymyrmex cornetzi TaxID=471704 RepID=A0A195EMS0_9HYME|nr:Protein outspread [Trachymyrmex cornetzi]
MSGGTAGGGGVRGTGAECRKFAPNIFNKSKCSSCFKQKEEHSAEALECNRSLNVNPKDSLFASKGRSKNMQFGFSLAGVERSPIHTAVYTRSSRRCEISECRQPCDLFSVHSSHLFLQHLYERRRPPPRVVGLSAFRTHLYNIGLAEQENCRLCGEKSEDSIHLLCHCPMLACKRYRAWGNTFLMPEDLDGAKIGDLISLVHGTGLSWTA